MYRFKTKEEFKADNQWSEGGYPVRWNSKKKMNHHIGSPIPEDCMSLILEGKNFYIDRWHFDYNNVVQIKTSILYDIY